MTLISYHGRVNRDGTIVCGGAGDNCKVIFSPTPVARLTKSHDDELAQLTERYNHLLAPYLEPREDGRVLRMLTTPEGDEVFVWAVPVGDEPGSAAALDEGYGSELRDPEEIRTALGLAPTTA